VGDGTPTLGDVRVGERVVIEANAVITRDVEPGATVVGTNRVVTGGAFLATARVVEFPVAQVRRGGLPLQLIAL
jgi:serine acetyltransferase